MNTTTAPAGYRPARVTMHVDDYSPESILPAYLPAPWRGWNGWELPVFDLATLARHHDALRRLFPAGGLVLTFDEHGHPSITDPDNPEDGDLVNRTEDNRATLGYASFTWEEVTQA
ncbi:hypothetical protein [Pseudoclavibacter helvolus]|uniref:hypothetical protein n=1 Tax=Pseudoclavibacter helvolus TaxID=255205 RepID=UPI003C714593